MENQKRYYQKRAKEYELVYTKAERQNDLQQLTKILSNAFQEKNIIEIACGTGYWTQVISETTSSIFATDYNEEVLQLAQNKTYQGKVEFEQIDFWKLPITNYEGLFGGFIWSHILKEDLPQFLDLICNRLQSNAKAIFIDNKYVKGSSTAISRIDKNGNTFQERKLASSERFEVLKNFPTRAEIQSILKPFNLKFHFTELDYYWMLRIEKMSKE